MKKLRRILAGILLGAAIALAGCASEAPGTQSGSPAPRSTQAVQEETPKPTPSLEARSTAVPTQAGSPLGVAEADLQDITIQFWHVWSFESGSALQTLIDEFNITNPYGIRAEVETLDGYGELSKAVYETLRSGEAPQLVVGFNNQILGWDAGGGTMVDLNTYVLDPEWGYSEAELADFYPVFWEQDIVNGKRIGLPAQRAAQILFYNATWAEELGFSDPPETIDALTEQLCAAAAEKRSDDTVENDGTGGWVVDTSTATVLAWIFAHGGEIETPGGYQFKSEHALEAIGYLKTLYDQGCAWLSANRYPNPEFADRKALLIASSTAGIPFQEDAFLNSGREDEWTAIPFPTKGDIPVIDVFGPSFAMVKSTPEKQLATWILMKWLLAPEKQARWIQASGHLPSRASTVDNLDTYIARHPQWEEALELIPLGRTEPHFASWGTVRWAVSDAAEQVFRIGLTEAQIPPLLEELDQTAAELHAQAR